MRLVTTLVFAGMVALSILVAPTGVAPSHPAHDEWEWHSDDCFVRGVGIVFDSFSLDVRAVEMIGTTTVELAFHNPDSFAREAILQVPFPAGATLTAFSLEMEEQVLDGRVQERNQARTTYEDAKARGEDAVLLEQAGNGMLRLSVFVPGGGERVLRASYVELLGLDSGARSYRFPTTGLNEHPVPVPNVHVDLIVESTHGVSGFALPGMQLKVDERTPNLIRAHADLRSPGEVDDLVATWTEGSGAWTSSLVLSDDPDAEALTSALVTLSIPGEGAETLPRDIVFVLDVSGSMDGQKMVQARESLREVLLSLRPDDRFGLVQFNDVATAITPELVTASSSHVSTYRQRLSSVNAGGSTNFDGGVQAGLRLLGDSGVGRVPIMVVLSDGLPTDGITDHTMIVDRMVDANHRGAAVHVLAIGLDADDTFLEDVAAKSGGSLLVLDPSDDLQDRLADFYTSLEDPILTDVTITIKGATARDLLPQPLPALYRDGTLRAAFRADLRSATTLTVTMSGVSSDGRETHTFSFKLSDAPVVPEVEQLWGQAKVEALLSDERLDGYDASRRGTIIEYAETYGVVTPYTSWVIARPPDVQYEGSASTAAEPQEDASYESSDGGVPLASNSGDSSGGVADSAYEPQEPAEPTLGGDDFGSNGTGVANKKPQPFPGVLAVLAMVAVTLLLYRRRR